MKRDPEEKAADQFIKEHASATPMDSTYNVLPDIRVHVYMYDMNVMNYRLFYAVNKAYTSFHIFYSLDDAMAFIDDGKSNNCEVMLSRRQMEKVDPSLEE